MRSLLAGRKRKGDICARESQQLREKKRRTILNRLRNARRKSDTIGSVHPTKDAYSRKCTTDVQTCHHVTTSPETVGANNVKGVVLSTRPGVQLISYRHRQQSDRQGRTTPMSEPSASKSVDTFPQTVEKPSHGRSTTAMLHLGRVLAIPVCTVYEVYEAVCSVPDIYDKRARSTTTVDTPLRGSTLPTRMCVDDVSLFSGGGDTVPTMCFGDDMSFSSGYGSMTSIETEASAEVVLANAGEVGQDHHSDKVKVPGETKTNEANEVLAVGEAQDDHHSDEIQQVRGETLLVDSSTSGAVMWSVRTSPGC